jgi:prolyl-tRNA synthetase
MASYGIGIGRLVGSIAAANPDAKGLIWPRTVSPFSYYLIAMGKGRDVNEAAEKIHEFLGDEEVLWDDREESPGVKLNDADLLGIPLRVIVSAKHLEAEEVEMHRRRTGETWTVPINKIMDFKL